MYIETTAYMYVDIKFYINIYIYIYAADSNGKRKTVARAISLIRLLFASCANGSLSFVHLLTKKQTSVIRLQTH
jgi:hypothetical protein